jgi:putative membrane protein
MALIETDPARRRYAVAALVAVPAGIMGGIVKLGCEVPFPPRTPERNITNPPQEMMQMLGIPYDVTHATVMFSGNQIPYVTQTMHFLFSVVFAVFYCVIAERYPQIKLWQGVAFGLFIWVAWHLVGMPLFGVVPAPWNQGWMEWFSEFVGHAAWMWVIELMRHDLRNRTTHEPDAEVALTSATR